MNDTFTYLNFLQSIEGNVESGIWTIELVKVLKDYDFRSESFSMFIGSCVYCTSNVNPSSRQYNYLDFYRVVFVFFRL